ncbi:tetratricopeptide repeat protein [Gymnodinialimonas sp.]
MTETFGALIGATILDRREAAGMTQRELAEESFPDPDKTDTIERRIRELESATPPANPRAKTYQPLCDTLNITRDAIRAMKAQAANRQQQADTERDELREDIGSLTDALTDPAGLSRYQLISLAELFGADSPESQSSTALRAFLTEKAEDYRRLLRDIDDLKNASSRFDNMRAAATEALSELDFDKAEELLENAREIIRDQLREPLELNAKLSERQAEIALLRNDPTQAFHILSAAADSFSILDPLDPARKRNLYLSLLYQHGLRYAGPALALAAEMTRTAIASCPRTTEAQLWAGLQNNLGNALANLGNRTGDTDLLHQAVTAYRAALEVYTKDASEMDWAMTRNNLGAALQNLGTRTGDTDVLQQAVTAYRAALEVYTKDNSEMDWAITQNNLGNALQNLGTRTGDTDLLHQAVTAYGAALEVRTRDTSEMDWAMTQNNLGIALRGLGNQTGDADLLHQAVTAYRAALEVRTRDASEMAWAMTQNNLGVALQNLGTRTGDTDVLHQAATAYGAALAVYTRDASEMDWAITQNNLALVFLHLAEHTSSENAKDTLSDALHHINNALEVFTPEGAAQYHQVASNNRAKILAARDALP